MNTTLPQLALCPHTLFLRAYRDCREPVYQKVLALVGSKELAEDIVQDVYIKIWQQRESFAQVKNLPAMIFVMARNHGLNLIARRKLEREVIARISRTSEQFFDLDVANEKKEAEQMLQLAIQALSPQRRRVYVLSQIEGRKRQEIADMLGISPFTVKAMLQRARTELRAYMTKQLQLKEKAKLRKFKKGSWGVSECRVA